jgi:peptidylprolyl isomerase
VETPHLNGKHVVFGEVVQGQEVVKQMGSVSLNSSGKTEGTITIDACGSIQG